MNEDIFANVNTDTEDGEGQGFDEFFQVPPEGIEAAERAMGRFNATPFSQDSTELEATVGNYRGPQAQGVALGSRAYRQAAMAVGPGDYGARLAALQLAQAFGRYTAFTSRNAYQLPPMYRGVAPTVKRARSPGR